MEGFSQFWSNFRLKNADDLPRIAFTDSSDSRIMAAVEKIKTLQLASPILVKDNTDTLAKGIEILLAGEVDAMISGATLPTANVVKAVIKKIGPRKGTKFISGQFLFESKQLKSAQQTPFLFSDCAVMPEPSPRALCEIAFSAAESYRFFTGLEPKVALLSFSTRGSAQHELVDRIGEAVELIKSKNPDFSVDGELQMDAAVDPEVARIKQAEDSPVAGQANVFIFPTLEAGNIGYKLSQRFSEARVAGPILWGLKKPVSDLSRGCTIEEIVDTTRCISQMVEQA